MRFHAFTEVSRMRESNLHNLGESSPRNFFHHAYRGVEVVPGKFPVVARDCLRSRLRVAA